MCILDKLEDNEFMLSEEELLIFIDKIKKIGFKIVNGRIRRHVWFYSIGKILYLHSDNEDVPGCSFLDRRFSDSKPVNYTSTELLFNVLDKYHKKQQKHL